MKYRFLLAALVVALFSSCCGCGSKTELFNGQDLTGWVGFLDPASGVAADAVYSVKEGNIHIAGLPFGYLRTAEKYGDYKFHAEWRWIGEGTNSGIFHRVLDGDKIWPNAIECQLCSGKAGDYVITITVDGEMLLSGSQWTNEYAYILHHNSGGSAINVTYQGSMRKVEIGNCANIGQYAFSNCCALTSVKITDGVTAIGKYAFYKCSALASVSVPGSVTSIGENAFQGCPGVAFYDFSKHTAVPTLANTQAFFDIFYDCEIRVPAALVDEWKAATNWATYASNIVGV
jgi:hypothetical protein